MPGTRVADRFEIERTAGTGGMGTVYRARDLRDGGVVALKLLRDDGGDAGVRFEREARLLARLEHPGIVRCVDHGRTAEGVAWLAMEWLDGEDLEARLSRAPKIPVDETVALGRRVAEALAAAHAAGVVHRDVKPSNIFLPDGSIARAKLIDFGIARGAAERRATMTGAAVGTPAYMAPEQARGHVDVDLRADVFSLGCVLFECLAGRPPFEGQHAMAILAKLLLEPAPPLRDLVPEAPPALAALIASMLAKDPAARPGGGPGVVAALDAFVAGEPAPSSRTTGVASVRRAPGLTGLEQRLVSVIVAGARARAAPDAETLAATASSEDLVKLQHVLAPFGARIEPLADGSFVVALSGGGGGGATDQAARAARCALAMRDALPEGPLALATGRGLLEGHMPIGEAIDRAVTLLRAWQRAGVEGLVGRARAVVDTVTAGLLDARFVVEARGDLLELTGERDALLDAARTLFGKPTPCVGRDRDIASIEAIFAECAEETASRAALVTGPAGIGKSRVAHEVLRRVRARGDAGAIWFARGDPMGAGSSMRLLAELAERAVGIVPGDAPPGKEEKLRAYAASRLEGEAAVRVAEFLGELVGVPFADEGRVQLRAARQDARLYGDQIRRALEDLLEAECARGPVLVLLEDLHWADAASIAFFEAALRRFAERPLMVLALARPEVRERFPGLWADRLHATALPELSRKASERLVLHALGDRAAPAAVARIVEQAAGNPFYLEELVRAQAEGNGDSAPGTVLAMMQSRLESLSPEARRLLRAGSVFGEAFWIGGVRALLGGEEEDDISLVELLEREMVRARESRFAGEREICFRHALVREAAYGMLTPADLVTGHRLAGAWLEQAGERDAARLAEHFERGRDLGRAAACYQRAAEQALEANDLGAVIARARRVADLGASGEVLGAALLCLGEAHLWRGEFAEARSPLAEAARLLPRGSTLWFQTATMRAWALREVADEDRLVTALAAEIQEAFGPSPAGQALVTAARIATHLVTLGRLPETQPFEALLAPARADPASDPLVAAHADELSAFRAISAGDLPAAGAAFTASATRFDQVGDARQAVRLRNNAGSVLACLGDFEHAEAELRAALGAADRLGIHNMSAILREGLGAVLFYRGALDEARALEEQAVEALAAQGDVKFECCARAYLAAVLLAAGDAEGADAAAARAVERSGTVESARSFALAVRARALLARSLPEAALRAAADAIEILDRLGGIDEGEGVVRLTFAEVLQAAGEHARAAAALASARDHILARAARIGDPSMRRSFLERIPEHARTLALVALAAIPDAP